MNKKLTREEVMVRIKQRRALAEARKRAEERKALNERRAARTARPVVRKPLAERAARPVVRKPLAERAARPVVRKPLAERAARPAARPVLIERTNKLAGRTETLMENINRRNRSLKLNPAQEKMYTTLAENISKATNKYRNVLNEATQAHPNAVNNQAGVGLVKTFFDIFYGYFPNLITPLIASVQPMKTEQGYIFWLEYTAGSDKGMVKKGDVLIDPFKVNTPVEYTSDRVTINEGEDTPTWGPVVPQSVKLDDFELVWADDENFTVEGEDITGVVTLVNDMIKVDLTGADVDKVEKITYAYNNAFAPTEVPELEANVRRTPIEAKYRTIKTNYAFTAAFGFEAEHGADLGEKLAEAAMFELKRETDLEAVGKIMHTAPTTVTWNRDAGFAVGGYNDHKLTFVDAIIRAANIIFAKSKRVRGNVLLVGMDALNVIETLPSYVGTEMGDQLEGAGVVGHIKKMPVIAVPELPENEWAVIYKSADNNLDAGLVFAPYIPVFATEPVTLDDLLIRRAFITAYALKVVNADYFVKGKIINHPTALPIYVMSKDGTDTNLGEIDVDAGLDIFG